MENMSEEQRTRFEFFMRSHFAKSKVEKIVVAALSGQKGATVAGDFVIVVSGLAKLFLGELMETGAI